MNPILARLGLTPEIIRQHVVRFTPTPTKSPDLAAIQYRREWRARNLARGLTGDGKPRRRLPNGQRKPRKPRGRNARAASVPASQREAGHHLTTP